MSTTEHVRYETPWWWSYLIQPPQPKKNQQSDEEVESKEILNKIIKFFKKKALTFEEELLDTDDYIRDIEINRTNIRCISTSILTISGFLLPILFGIFYFIVKDSSSIHVNIHWTIILGIISSIFTLFTSIYLSVNGVRAPKPPEQFLTKLDKYTYLKSIEINERNSSERSILFLGFTILLIIITFLGLYYCIMTTQNSIANEIINATTNAS